MAGVVSAIQTRLKLEEATSSKHDVTPGTMVVVLGGGGGRGKRSFDPVPSPLSPVYLIDELVALALSSPDAGATVLDFVAKKLAPARASPVSLRKTLRLAAAACAAGPSDFKRGLAKQAQLIR